MSLENLDQAIGEYCKLRNFMKTFENVKNGEFNYISNLEEVFDKHFNKESKSVLSFTYEINNSQRLLKKRLSQMNENKKPKRKNNKECVTKIKSEGIPESFLKLLDELCIERKDARKFFENSDQWSYIKSDRKIYCTKAGKFFRPGKAFFRQNESFIIKIKFWSENSLFKIDMKVSQLN
jgi:hypothetical protein